MAGRDLSFRAEPGPSLPAFERLAPSPPPALVHGRIEALSSPGDVVIDLHGRGGWIARAAIDRQRRAISLESNPLSRLLAELVLRPPDLRHLDAAFQSLAAAPRGDSSLRPSIGATFASRCTTCGRSVVLDELIWEAREDEPAARPVRKHYRCTVCRDQVGGGEQRHAEPDAGDLERASDRRGYDEARAAIRDRFPDPDGAANLADELLDLHTPRQLAGLHAILGRIEDGLRAAPVAAGLRLALLHAILPASRLNTFPGRIAGLRIVDGHVRLPAGSAWRERNPWVAFEDGYRLVRAFIQRLDGTTHGAAPARFGDDVLSLTESASNVLVRLGTATTFRGLVNEAGSLPATTRSRVRLVVVQPPPRPSQDRLLFAYLAAAWSLGREAASLLPVEGLLGSPGRPPWSWQAVALRRSLDAVAPLLSRDARVAVLVEPGGPEALVAAALGGVGAGYRLADARLAEPGDEIGGIVELLAPGATLPPGPRSRANVSLPHHEGGAGDPDVVPGRGLFAPPERVARTRFSPAQVAATVTDSAVDILKARGEPASTERLLGEILVGLDRAGQLRRLVTSSVRGARSGDVAGPASTATDGPTVDGPAGLPPGWRDGGEDHIGDRRTRTDRGADPGRDTVESVTRRAAADTTSTVLDPTLWSEEALRTRDPSAAGDPVDYLLELIRAELARADHPRLQEIEPDRWWLVAADDIGAAATPLADRVEWSVFSLLATAGRISEAAFTERIAGLFRGHDLPDEALVRVCLDSYRSLASTPDALQSHDDLLKRSQEHSAIIALLADTGHRLGMRVWIGRREQPKRVAGRPLARWLDEKEQRTYLPLISRGAVHEELEQVDCIWYVRSKAAFLFEVEWTAMLGEPVLRRHAAIPTDERLVRFLVVAPERTELLRYKLDRSPLLRRALETDNWHILKSNHLRAFAARDTLDLDDLEPYLGLDAPIERGTEQLPLFGR